MSKDRQRDAFVKATTPVTDNVRYKLRQTAEKYLIDFLRSGMESLAIGHNAGQVDERSHLSVVPMKDEKHGVGYALYLKSQRPPKYKQVGASVAVVPLLDLRINEGEGPGPERNKELYIILLSHGAKAQAIAGPPIVRLPESRLPILSNFEVAALYEVMMCAIDPHLCANKKQPKKPDQRISALERR